MTSTEVTNTPSVQQDGVSDEYEAVVYDLDGTLVRLDVDWAQVEREVETELEAVGVDPDDHDMWEMLTAAEDSGIGEQVHEIIAAHEREGAEDSIRLPTADILPSVEVAVGVCSLNCEAACRTALEKHDLVEHVGVVAGRDSVPARKPDPRALTSVLDELGVEPEHALFVGDSESDEETAERAGTDFQWV